MEHIIKTHALTRKFGSFTAVNNINLFIPPGRIFGFLGPNGSGKSTTIRMLCGILEPTSGSASVLGYDLSTEGEKIKKKIGYMSQKFSLYDDLTVYENLEFFAGLYDISRKKKRDKIEQMIVMAGLVSNENMLAGKLSVGWRQRLALGCAIISEPMILFLDEPTSGVSPTGRREFFKAIKELISNGTTVMLTTHFMDEAERCNDIAFISQGNLIACDTPDNLKKNFIKGCMVEMEIPDGMAKISEIQGLPYVSEASIHGAYAHILIKDKLSVSELERHTGVKAEIISPSLEDVFLSLAKKHQTSAV